MGEVVYVKAYFNLFSNDLLLVQGIVELEDDIHMSKLGLLVTRQMDGEVSLIVLVSM